MYVQDSVCGDDLHSMYGMVVRGNILDLTHNYICLL